MLRLAGAPAPGGVVDRPGLLAAAVAERSRSRSGSDARLTLELHSPASLALMPQTIPGASHPMGGGEAAVSSPAAPLSHPLFPPPLTDAASLPPPSQPFVPPPTPPLPALHARFAAGRACFRSDVARLFGAELSTPGGLELLAALVAPSGAHQTAALWLAPLPTNIRAAAAAASAAAASAAPNPVPLPPPPTYGQLVAECCEAGAVPLGLLRAAPPRRDGSDVFDGPPSPQTAPHPGCGFVLTNPPAWLRLRHNDCVYALAPREWGVAHSLEHARARQHVAAEVVQAAWRRRRRRRRAAAAAAQDGVRSE